jgi:hypothetical protein
MRNAETTLGVLRVTGEPGTRKRVRRVRRGLLEKVLLSRNLASNLPCGPGSRLVSEREPKERVHAAELNVQAEDAPCTSNAPISPSPRCISTIAPGADGQHERLL